MMITKILKNQGLIPTRIQVATVPVLLKLALLNQQTSYHSDSSYITPPTHNHSHHEDENTRHHRVPRADGYHIRHHHHPPHSRLVKVLTASGRIIRKPAVHHRLAAILHKRDQQQKQPVVEFSTAADNNHNEESNAAKIKQDDEEESQAEDMFSRGTKKLIKTENGREKLREGSFNIDETARVILEAAEENVDEGEDGFMDDEVGKHAKDTREKIERGESDGLTDKVKGRVVGRFGQAG